MQQSAIHDPYAGKTPSQRKEADTHKQRLARIAAAAKPEVKSQKTIERELKQLPPEPVFSFGEWVERQERLNPIPEDKEYWFSIECEIDPERTIHIRDIQKAVAAYFNVTITDMKSARRDHAILMPRQIAAYLARILTVHSLPEIGRRFGGRDHTTILSAYRKIARLIKTEIGLRHTIETLTESLGGARA